MQEALRYFAIPSGLWPLGLRVQEEALLSVEMRLLSCMPEAQVIVNMISASIEQLLSADLAAAWLSRKASDTTKTGEDLLKHCRFAVHFGLLGPDLANPQLLGPHCDKDSQACSNQEYWTHSMLPEQLRTAVTIIGQRQYLQISWLGECSVQPMQWSGDDNSVAFLTDSWFQSLHVSLWGMRGKCHAEGMSRASIMEVVFT